MTDFLEVSPYEIDGGNLIGKGPRKIPANEWKRRNGTFLSGLSAIRAKCVDCCSGEFGEVRKCTAAECVLWPLRMGSVPKGFREAFPPRKTKDA